MLAFKDTLDCVIWFRIGVVMDKIKHPIIGTHNVADVCHSSRKIPCAFCPIASGKPT